MPDSGIRQFGQWIINENWDCVAQDGEPTDQAIALQTVLEGKVDEIFPAKTSRVTGKDKRFITAELKQLDRQKKTNI